MILMRALTMMNMMMMNMVLQVAVMKSQGNSIWETKWC